MRSLGIYGAPRVDRDVGVACGDSLCAFTSGTSGSPRGDGAKIGLHPASEKGPQPGNNGGTIFGFGLTQSIDDVVSALGKKGVTFQGPIVDDANGAIRLAFFSDPDGNDLYLCELKHEWRPDE